MRSSKVDHIPPERRVTIEKSHTFFLLLLRYDWGISDMLLHLFRIVALQIYTELACFICWSDNISILNDLSGSLYPLCFSLSDIVLFWSALLIVILSNDGLCLCQDPDLDVLEVELLGPAATSEGLRSKSQE